LKKQKTYYRK